MEYFNLRESLSKEQNGHMAKREQELDPAQAPILTFVGGVSHGMLAKDIDRELYGSET